ncbi:MAG TPA: NmrA family NAD(P)-binding protein, partial [Chitinophagaceae bacterium]|nr:NmrA family NAD(P)-binding protein [Chitinophagaceae bacterium]
IESFTEAAKKAGVQKLVLLSGRGEEEAQLCEKIVINSGLEWGIVRASWFMQNFSEGFFLDSILSGHAILPKGSAPEPFVDADDIADMAVKALTDDKHSKKLYELTGPELLTFKEIFSAVSTALDRPIIYEEVSMEEYVELLKKYKVPDEYIWLIKYLFTEVFDGRNESIVNDIENVLGRKPTSFKAYIEKTKKTGIWN